jgi:hypothetical protein
MSGLTQEKGPVSLAGRPTRTTSLLRKVSHLNTTAKGFIQAFGLYFLVGAGSAALTLDVLQIVTFWCRS